MIHLEPNGPSWRIEPFLHFQKNRIYNPLTDTELNSGHPWYTTILELRQQQDIGIENHLVRELLTTGWLISSETDILSRYLLKVVTLEATAHCNQGCSFCPVSIDPKPIHTMSLAFYEHIVSQIQAYSDTIDGLFMMNYNEPTIDKFFIDRIKILKKYEIPVCLNTNGSGLTPSQVRKIIDLGKLRFISVNLSTLDAHAYRTDRNYTRFDLVLRNLDYLKDHSIADEMVIAVLGHGDALHQENYQSIQRHFHDSHFTVKSFRITNRAGHIPVGKSRRDAIRDLAGCDLMGSRVLQHVHINSYGLCFICCHDYAEEYLVGDLNELDLQSVLVSPEMRKLRAWTYGIDKAPDDYLCRRCVFALACTSKRS